MGFAVRGPMATGGEDPATTAWVNAVISDGGTVSAGRRTLINNLIVDLKASTIWTKLDRLWLWAAENTQSALRDLVATALAANASGTPTFTADDGYTMSGVVGITTNFNPATAGGLYTQNSAHVSFWAFDTPTVNVQAIGNGATRVAIYPSFTGNVFMKVNDNSGDAFATANPTGFYLANRSSSTARTGYINGTSIGSYGSVASVALDSQDIFAGTFSYDKTMSAFSLGMDVDSVQLTFYNILRTYMTAVGVP